MLKEEEICFGVEAWVGRKWEAEAGSASAEVCGSTRSLGHRRDVGKRGELDDNINQMDSEVSRSHSRQSQVRSLLRRARDHFPPHRGRRADHNG